MGTDEFVCEMVGAEGTLKAGSGNLTVEICKCHYIHCQLPTEASS